MASFELQNGDQLPGWIQAQISDGSITLSISTEDFDNLGEYEILATFWLDDIQKSTLTIASLTVRCACDTYLNPSSFEPQNIFYTIQMDPDLSLTIPEVILWNPQCGYINSFCAAEFT